MRGEKYKRRKKCLIDEKEAFKIIKDQTISEGKPQN